jgi:plastocyanin
MRKAALAIVAAVISFGMVPSRAATTTQIVVAGFNYAPSGYVTADPLGLNGGAVALPAGAPAVAAGDTLAFTSVDALPHSVSFKSGPKIWTEKTLGGPGATANLVLTAFPKGTYVYYCKFHAGMRGSFIVQ